MEHTTPRFEALDHNLCGLSRHFARRGMSVRGPAAKTTRTTVDLMHLGRLAGPDSLAGDRLLSRAELENVVPQNPQQRPASKEKVGSKRRDAARLTKAAPQAPRISPRSRSPQASQSRSPSAPTDRATPRPLIVVSTRASPRVKTSPSRPTRRSGAGAADRSTSDVCVVRDGIPGVDDKRDTTAPAGVLGWTRDAQRDAQWRRLLATRAAELHNALHRERRALLRLALSEWRATTRAATAQIALLKRRAAHIRASLLSSALAAWDAAAHTPRRDHHASPPSAHRENEGRGGRVSSKVNKLRETDRQTDRQTDRVF